PSSTHFPYTTLFRSVVAANRQVCPTISEISFGNLYRSILSVAPVSDPAGGPSVETPPASRWCHSSEPAFAPAGPRHARMTFLCSTAPKPRLEPMDANQGALHSRSYQA